MTAISLSLRFLRHWGCSPETAGPRETTALATAVSCSRQPAAPRESSDLKGAVLEHGELNYCDLPMTATNINDLSTSLVIA